MTHLDEQVLSEYSLDPEGVDDRDGVEAHLAECDICRDQLAVYSAIDAALVHLETAGYVEQLRTPNARFEDFRAKRIQATEEEETARAILKPLLKSPLKFRTADLASRPRCHTLGMVRVLCAEANARHEQRPKFSHLLAATAYAIATKLENVPEGSKRAAMGMALREGANALRYLGRFAEALKALDYAETLFDATPSTDAFDIAIVRFIRATVCMKSDRLSEGIILARDAAQVFREYGAQARELGAVMAEACCLSLSGHAQDAVDAFDRVIALSRESGDTRMLVYGLHNGAR
ncbi:MAG: hypothetical protein ACRD3J_21305, partial [Thermoanaerobaculia bacterium]